MADLETGGVYRIMDEDGQTFETLSESHNESSAGTMCEKEIGQ